MEKIALESSLNKVSIKFTEETWIRIRIEKNAPDLH